MTCHFRTSVIVLTLLAGVGVASAGDVTVGRASPPDDHQAEAPKKLSPAQRERIFVLIRQGNVSVKRPPAGVPIAVGARLPPSTELYSMPEAATKKVPDAKGYVYTIVNGILVFVDPASRKVVATARQ